MENSAEENSVIHTKESTEFQQEPCSSQTLPMMPQKRSTYGDIITTRTETDVQEPQTVITTTQKHDEPGAAVQETQSEENASPEVNTSLPTTPIQCSTSRAHARRKKTKIKLPQSEQLSPRKYRPKP